MTKRANKQKHAEIARRVIDMARMRAAWIQIGAHGEAHRKAARDIDAFSRLGIGVETSIPLPVTRQPRSEAMPPKLTPWERLWRALRS